MKANAKKIFIYLVVILFQISHGAQESLNKKRKESSASGPVDIRTTKKLKSKPEFACDIKIFGLRHQLSLAPKLELRRCKFVATTPEKLQKHKLRPSHNHPYIYYGGGFNQRSLSPILKQELEDNKLKGRKYNRPVPGFKLPTFSGQSPSSVQAQNDVIKIFSSKLRACLAREEFDDVRAIADCFLSAPSEANNVEQWTQAAQQCSSSAQSSSSSSSSSSSALPHVVEPIISARALPVNSSMPSQEEISSTQPQHIRQSPIWSKIITDPKVADQTFDFRLKYLLESYVFDAVRPTATSFLSAYFSAKSRPETVLTQSLAEPSLAIPVATRNQPTAQLINEIINKAIQNVDESALVQSPRVSFSEMQSPVSPGSQARAASPTQALPGLAIYDDESNEIITVPTSLSTAVQQEILPVSPSAMQSLYARVVAHQAQIKAHQAQQS